VADGDGSGIPIWMEQEPGSAGKIVVEHYTRDVLPAYALRGEKPTGPIEVKAQPFLAAIEAGNVIAVRADWNADIRNELDAFPDGDHDDFVSAASLAHYKLRKMRFGGATWGRKLSGVQAQAAVDTAQGVKKKFGVVW